MKLPLLLSLLATCAALATSQAQIVDTTAAWNGTDNVRSWGNTGPAASGFPQFYNTPIFGQTFSAPDGFDRLDTFKVFIAPRTDFNRPAAAGTFTATVAVFDTATQKIGAIAWTSGSMAVSASEGFTAYEFAVNAILSPSQAYVFYGEQTSGAGSYMWGSSQTNLYSGGTFVYSATAGATGTFLPFTGTAADLAFTATFSDSTPLVPVPEPSTYALFGAAGCMTLVAVRRRLQRRKIAG